MVKKIICKFAVEICRDKFSLKHTLLYSSHKYAMLYPSGNCYRRSLSCLCESLSYRSNVLRCVTLFFVHTDSLAYRFGKRGGLLTFAFSESERTDTKQDSLAFGLITTQANAILMRVVSGNSNDYLELELVCFQRTHLLTVMY